MSIEATWILFTITNLIGGIIIFITLYILRPVKSKKIITTYSNQETQEENGPILELPKGILLPRDKPRHTKV